MTNHSRYSCVHLIEPKPRKVPRISLVACDFYRPKIISFQFFYLLGNNFWKWYFFSLFDSSM